jgi:hypothetical protein
MNEFYLTLASNSSMTYYPDNKTSSFTVQLPKTLTLDGKWNVALAEVHYQNTFLNVSEDSNVISFRRRAKSTKFIKEDADSLEQCIIESKNYHSIEEIVNTINSFMTGFLKESNSSFLIFDNEKEKVFIGSETRKLFSEIYFNNRLAFQFGYDSNANALDKSKESVRKAHLSHGITDEIIIYCDILEPQMFGHTMAKIIRIVNIDKKKNVIFGQACQKEFMRLHYIPILKKEFETISIELREKTGKFVPFEYGTTMFVLHFKKME